MNKEHSVAVVALEDEIKVRLKLTPVPIGKLIEPRTAFGFPAPISGLVNTHYQPISCTTTITTTTTTTTIAWL